MHTSTSYCWLVVAVAAAMLLAVVAGCAGETVVVPGETVVVEKEVVKTVEVPGETVVKEVVKEVQVPGETVVVEKVVTETVEVPGETVVVEKEVVKTVEVPGETVTVEVVKEVQVPGETVVVEKVVTETVEVPGETVVVEKVVTQTVEVPGETVVVEKEVVKTVEVEIEVVKEVPLGYVTDPTTGKAVTAPQYGGSLTYARRIQPEHTDPQFSWQPLLAIDAVAETLAFMDWGIPRDEFAIKTEYFPIYAAKGNLAESWEMPDDKTIVFNIRQGVNWHNKAPMNGRELDAFDIEYNYNRFLGLGSGFTEGCQGCFYVLADKGFESVTATDKWTVVFKLEGQAQDALAAMIGADHLSAMLPPEVIKEHGDVKDWRNLVGTGPYEITDWVEGTSITWNKVPNYWGFDEKYPQNRLPYIDELESLIIQDEATRIAGLRAGKLDFLGYLGYVSIENIDQVQSIQRTNPELEVDQLSLRSETSYMYDQTQPPFDDVRVRKAMQMAVDLETINYTYYKGTALWRPQGLIGEAIPGYHQPFDTWPEEVQKGYMYDPEGAEALLDVAGYPRGADGTRFKTVMNNGYEKDPAYPQILVEYFKAIGVEVEINTYPDGASSEAAQDDGSWVGMRGSSPGSNENPMRKLRDGSHSTQRIYGAKNVKDHHLVDAMIEAAEAATSIEEQQRLFREVDMYRIERHWDLWGPKAVEFSLYWPWVKGYNGEFGLGPFYQNVILARLWIDSEMKAAMGH